MNNNPSNRKGRPRHGRANGAVAPRISVAYRMRTDCAERLNAIAESLGLSNTATVEKLIADFSASNLQAMELQKLKQDREAILSNLKTIDSKIKFYES